jgi:hypothetical protein
LRTLRGSPGWSFGYATVRVFDNCGNPVINAEVTGTFSGDYDEGVLPATTNAHGIAIFTTSSEVQDPTFSFCVNGINHAALSYNAADNVENCDNYVGPAR